MIDRFSQLNYFLAKLQERYYISCIEYLDELSHKADIEEQKKKLAQKKAENVSKKQLRHKEKLQEEKRKTLPKDITDFIESCTDILILDDQKKKELTHIVKKTYYKSTPFSIQDICTDLDIHVSSKDLTKIKTLARASYL
jgi:hypothetical protein